MQTVLEQGSIDKPLTFDVGLIQLSFIPVCSLNTCNISVKLCRGFALQCFFITIFSGCNYVVELNNYLAQSHNYTVIFVTFSDIRKRKTMSRFRSTQEAGGVLPLLAGLRDGERRLICRTGYLDKDSLWHLV